VVIHNPSNGESNNDNQSQPDHRRKLLLKLITNHLSLHTVTDIEKASMAVSIPIYQDEQFCQIMFVRVAFSEQINLLSIN
jgi:hypothetical protein